ncbi:Uncharacterized protein TCM_028575 [Theobroma cacao]|uniref:Uncharacterized protein n=1 Tax=Theobroma cacao TaxID=3641 RepID=A0A061G9U5_THECC|nr:Uncharacterized protein TCM_028575 [Theobroma cacao]
MIVAAIYVDYVWKYNMDLSGNYLGRKCKDKVRVLWWRAGVNIERLASENNQRHLRSNSDVISHYRKEL